MKKFYIFVLSLAVISFSYPALAQDEMVQSESAKSGIEVNMPYAFATISNAPTGAAFFDLINHGNEEDKLLSVDGDIAQILEVHENYIDEDDGTMMMRKIPGIVIGAQSTTKLKPTGKHIMLIRLNEQLRLEDEFDLTLNFEKSASQTISVKVIPPGTQPMSSLKKTGDKLKEMIMTIDGSDSAESTAHKHVNHMKHNKAEVKVNESEIQNAENTKPLDPEKNTVHYE